MEIAASIVLTPIIMWLWGKAFPVTYDREFNFVTFEELKKRNSILNFFSILFHFIGLILPIKLLTSITSPGTEIILWGAALMFGSMVIVPFLFICVATLPFGIKRFKEYWRFYELKYKIGIRGIQLVYIPIGLLGLIGFWKIYNAI